MSNECKDFIRYILDESNGYQKLLPITSQDEFNKQNLSIQSEESSSDSKSTETTKSELIQRILDSFKPVLNFKSSSNSTTNTSLSSIDKTIIS
jgi:hypothetical protein